MKIKAKKIIKYFSSQTKITQFLSGAGAHAKQNANIDPPITENPESSNENPDRMRNSRDFQGINGGGGSIFKGYTLQEESS